MYYEVIRNLDHTFSVAKVYEEKEGSFADVVLLPEVYITRAGAQLSAAMFTRDLRIVADIFTSTIGEHALTGS